MHVCIFTLLIFFLLSIAYMSYEYVDNRSRPWLSSLLTAAIDPEKDFELKCNEGSNVGDAVQGGSSTTSMVSGSRIHQRDNRMPVNLSKDWREPSRTAHVPIAEKLLPFPTADSDNDRDGSDASFEEILRVGALGGVDISGGNGGLAMAHGVRNTNHSTASWRNDPGRGIKEQFFRREALRRNNGKERKGPVGKGNLSPFPFFSPSSSLSLSSGDSQISSFSQDSPPGTPSCQEAVRRDSDYPNRRQNDAKMRKGESEFNTSQKGQKEEKKKNEKRKPAKPAPPPVISLRLLSLNASTQAKKREKYVNEKKEEERMKEKKSELLRRNISPQVVAVGKRFYDEALAIREHKKSLALQHEEEEEKKAKKTCSFTPTLSAGSERIMAVNLNVSYRPPDQQSVQDKERANRVEWLRLQKQADELRAMPFTPQIGSGSSFGHQKKEKVQGRGQAGRNHVGSGGRGTRLLPEPERAGCSSALTSSQDEVVSAAFIPNGWKLPRPLPLPSPSSIARRDNKSFALEDRRGDSSSMNRESEIPHHSNRRRWSRSSCSRSWRGRNSTSCERWRRRRKEEDEEDEEEEEEEESINHWGKGKAVKKGIRKFSPGRPVLPPPFFSHSALSSSLLLSQPSSVGGAKPSHSYTLDNRVDNVSAEASHKKGSWNRKGCAKAMMRQESQRGGNKNSHGGEISHQSKTCTAFSMPTVLPVSVDAEEHSCSKPKSTTRPAISSSSEVLHRFHAVKTLDATSLAIPYSTSNLARLPGKGGGRGRVADSGKLSSQHPQQPQRQRGVLSARERRSEPCADLPEKAAAPHAGRRLFHASDERQRARTLHSVHFGPPNTVSSDASSRERSKESNRNDDGHSMVADEELEGLERSTGSRSSGSDSTPNVVRSGTKKRKKKNIGARGWKWKRRELECKERRYHPDAVIRSHLARHREDLALHLGALFHKFAAHSTIKQQREWEEYEGRSANSRRTASSGAPERMPEPPHDSGPTVTLAQIRPLIRDVYPKDLPLVAALSECVRDPHKCLRKEDFIHCLINFLFPLDEEDVPDEREKDEEAEECVDEKFSTSSAVHGVMRKSDGYLHQSPALPSPPTVRRYYSTPDTASDTLSFAPLPAAAASAGSSSVPIITTTTPISSTSACYLAGDARVSAPVSFPHSAKAVELEVLLPSRGTPNVNKVDKGKTPTSSPFPLSNSNSILRKRTQASSVGVGSVEREGKEGGGGSAGGGRGGVSAAASAMGMSSSNNALHAENKTKDVRGKEMRDNPLSSRSTLPSPGKESESKANVLWNKKCVKNRLGSVLSSSSPAHQEGVHTFSLSRAHSSPALLPHRRTATRRSLSQKQSARGGAGGAKGDSSCSYVDILRKSTLRPTPRSSSSVPRSRVHRLQNHTKEGEEVVSSKKGKSCSAVVGEAESERCCRSCPEGGSAHSGGRGGAARGGDQQSPHGLSERMTNHSFVPSFSSLTLPFSSSSSSLPCAATTSTSSSDLFRHLMTVKPGETLRDVLRSRESFPSSSICRATMLAGTRQEDDPTTTSVESPSASTGEGQTSALTTSTSSMKISGAAPALETLLSRLKEEKMKGEEEKVQEETSTGCPAFHSTSSSVRVGLGTEEEEKNNSKPAGFCSEGEEEDAISVSSTSTTTSLCVTPRLVSPPAGLISPTSTTNIPFHENSNPVPLPPCVFSASWSNGKGRLPGPSSLLFSRTDEHGRSVADDKSSWTSAGSHGERIEDFPLGVFCTSIRPDAAVAPATQLDQVEDSTSLETDQHTWNSEEQCWGRPAARSLRCGKFQRISPGWKKRCEQGTAHTGDGPLAIPSTTINPTSSSNIRNDPRRDSHDGDSSDVSLTTEAAPLLTTTSESAGPALSRASAWYKCFGEVKRQASEANNLSSGKFFRAPKYCLFNSSSALRGVESSVVSNHLHNTGRSMTRMECHSGEPPRCKACTGSPMGASTSSLECPSRKGGGKETACLFLGEDKVGELFESGNTNASDLSHALYSSSVLGQEPTPLLPSCEEETASAPYDGGGLRKGLEEKKKEGKENLQSSTGLYLNNAYVDPMQNAYSGVLSAVEEGKKEDGVLSGSKSKASEGCEVKGSNEFLDEVDHILRINDEELDKAFQSLHSSRHGACQLMHI